MTISATIIADSINEQGVRLTTMQLTYPRFIHSELMTHRVFSRNASSSRAIPVETMIQNILDDTAMPIHWGKNQPGMQAHEEQDALIDLADITGQPRLGTGFEYIGNDRESAWNFARDRAIEVARAFHAAGYHKQIVNRILEPFMHISVIVSATNFDNFYWLRCHADAQPEIKALADAMYAVHSASTPKQLRPGEWHLPYITEDDRRSMYHQYLGHGDFDMEEYPTPIEDLIKMSVARCARVSYLTHDGKEPSREKDMELYERLVGSTPLHASPAEHQAYADEYDEMGPGQFGYYEARLSGNFDPGFVQFRKTLDDEFCETYEAVT